MTSFFAGIFALPWTAVCRPCAPHEEEDAKLPTDLGISFDAGPMDLDHMRTGDLADDALRDNRPKDSCEVSDEPVDALDDYFKQCRSMGGQKRRDSHSEFDMKYEMKEAVLGTGCCGEVREAICRQTGEEVAVKTFRKQHMGEDLRSNLRAEHEILASLKHPVIVKLAGVYESDEEYHIVTEKLDGGELFDRVAERRRLSEPEAADVAYQILRALRYMHAQDILHRDVKPENILYESSGGRAVKLIDFGFAVKMDGSEDLNACGTMLYVAPEVLAGRTYDDRCDIWSVGAVVYAMLTGRPLYTGSEKCVYSKSTKGQVDFCRTFNRLSKGAQDFVRHLLTVDPSERPSASQAMEHHWIRQMAPDEAHSPKSPSRRRAVEKGWMPGGLAKVGRAIPKMSLRDTHR